MPPSSTEPSDMLPIFKILNLKDEAYEGQELGEASFLSFFWLRVIKPLLGASPILGSKGTTWSRRETGIVFMAFTILQEKEMLTKQ